MFQTVQMCRRLVPSFHCAGPVSIPGRICVIILMRKKQNQYGLPPSTSVLPCEYQQTKKITVSSSYLHGRQKDKAVKSGKVSSKAVLFQKLH
jgi:hypothetical protein